jgi:transposase
MPTITIGLDVAKHVFQLHCVDATGQVVIRKKLRRRELLEFAITAPSSSTSR